MKRKETRTVKVGQMYIGGDAPISIQSMTNTDTRDIQATAAQINALAEAGCDIVRLAVFDEACAGAVKEIKKRTAVPLVADIHFDYRLALEAIKNGIDKLRINPGNIGGEARVREVVACAKDYAVPIRVGVNAGSLDKDIQSKYSKTAGALVQSALTHVGILEKNHFYDTVISVKCSDVALMYEAYCMLSAQVDYPLHLGVTEAGSLHMATVKSAAGIGALLLNGIGDTLRVSITGDPVQEVYAAKDILRALGIRKGVEIISCPTCGRNLVPIEPIVAEVERRLAHVDKPIKIAIMGCVVNGPGEAEDADIGLAAGKDSGLIFVKEGQPFKVKADRIIDELMSRIEKILETR